MENVDRNEQQIQVLVCIRTVLERRANRSRIRTINLCWETERIYHVTPKSVSHRLHVLSLFRAGEPRVVTQFMITYYRQDAVYSKLAKQMAIPAVVDRCGVVDCGSTITGTRIEHVECGICKPAPIDQVTRYRKNLWVIGTHLTDKKVVDQHHLR